MKKRNEERRVEKKPNPVYNSWNEHKASAKS